MQDLEVWAREIGLVLSPSQLEQFTAYERLLVTWNERISLTSIRLPRDIQIRHFFDSLTCAAVTGPLDGRSLIDVGSGAGFPGLPLKIIFPTLKLTLVDSVAKKARFLEEVVGELGLSDVTVIAERAEVVGQDNLYREQFDWAVARAVAELRILVELLLPLCRVGGHALAQKGESAAAEAQTAATAITALGGGEPQITSVLLPEVEQIHYLIVVDKVQTTPSRYPRRSGIPAKRPL